MANKRNRNKGRRGNIQDGQSSQNQTQNQNNQKHANGYAGTNYDPAKAAKGQQNSNNKNNNNQQKKQSNNWNNNKNQNDVEYYQKSIAEMTAKVVQLQKDRAKAEKEAANSCCGDHDTSMEDFDDGIYELRVQTARVEYVRKPTAAAPVGELGGQVQQAAAEQANQPFQNQSTNFVPNKQWNGRPRCDNCSKPHELLFCFDHVKARLEAQVLDDTNYKVQKAGSKPAWLSQRQIMDLQANGENFIVVSDAVRIQCANCGLEDHYQRDCPDNQAYYANWLLHPRNEISWDDKRFLFPNLVGQVRGVDTMPICEYCNTQHPDPEYACRDRLILGFLQYIWEAPKRSKVPNGPRCQHCFFSHPDEQPCAELYRALNRYHGDFMSRVLGKTVSKSHDCLFCYAGPHTETCDAQLEQTWRYVINAPKLENYKDRNCYARYPIVKTPFGETRRDFLSDSAHYVTERAKGISRALENTFINE